MLVTPLPGTNCENLRLALSDVLNKLRNVRGGVPSREDGFLTQYLLWTTDAMRQLRSHIHAYDVERLVLGSHHDRLLNARPSSAQPHIQRRVNGLLNLELDQRIAELEEAVADLDLALTRWSRLARYVIPDTTVFINHPSKLRELDFASELQVRETPIHLVIPIAVVDELDRLKESKNQEVRWRAGHTLGVLDEVLRQSPGPSQLRDKDISASQAQDIPHGAVTVEIVLDPPGHVRLPIDDDEIIDRALAIKPLTPSPITLLTYDTGQATRAWAAGLNVVKLKKNIGPEPTTTVKVKDSTQSDVGIDTNRAKR